MGGETARNWTECRIVSRDILVVVQDSAAGREALRAAVAMAQSAGGRLTIMTPVQRPPAWVNTPMTAAACGPLARDLEREATGVLQAARDAVPADLPLTTILTRQPLCEAVQVRLAQHPHDLLILGACRAGRRLTRRSPVPVITVPDPAVAEARSPAPPRPAIGRRAQPPIAARPAR